MKHVDFYPSSPEGGPPQDVWFFMMHDRRAADHVTTLRRHRSLPSIHGNLGYEICTFNRYTQSQWQPWTSGVMPKMLVDFLNRESQNGCLGQEELVPCLSQEGLPANLPENHD